MKKDSFRTLYVNLLSCQDWTDVYCKCSKQLLPKKFRYSKYYYTETYIASQLSLKIHINQGFYNALISSYNEFQNEEQRVENEDLFKFIRKLIGKEMAEKEPNNFRDLAKLRDKYRQLYNISLNIFEKKCEAFHKKKHSRAKVKQLPSSLAFYNSLLHYYTTISTKYLVGPKKTIPSSIFETKILPSLEVSEANFIAKYYSKNGNVYRFTTKEDISFTGIIEIQRILYPFLH
jgi:hypothetical protein